MSTSRDSSLNERDGRYHPSLIRCADQDGYWAVLRTDGSWTTTRHVISQAVQSPGRTQAPFDMMSTFDLGHGWVKDVLVEAGVQVELMGRAAFAARFGIPSA